MQGSIVRMVEADIQRPNHGPDPADGAVMGDPVESTHEYYATNGKACGVWMCSPGRILEEDHVEAEFATLLSGRLGIIDNEAGTEEIFVPGDSFFPPRGSSLTWVINETVRKFYMTAE